MSVLLIHPKLEPLNSMHLMGYLINIRITFKDPELVYSKAYGIIWDESATNYRGFEFFLLVE